MSDHVYIIAEIGINHNGSLDNCRKLIDAAVEAGCDAVKLQLFKARHLYPKSAGRLDWKNGDKEYSYDIYEAVERFELPELWIDALMTHCRSQKVELLSSVFDENGISMLVDKGLGRIKLSSYMITNLPVIDRCAAAGLPIIMSTGGATLGEVEDAVEAVKKHHSKLTLLHCSINYPTKLEDCNLGVIRTLAHAFPGIPVGYSDHTLEVSVAPVQAVYLGATVIEKHITLSKSMPGPDHFFALEPAELRKLVDDVRQAEFARSRNDGAIDPLLFGSSARVPYPHERYLRDFAFMCLFASRKIEKGEVIKRKDIAVLRPGKKPRGIEPKYLHLFEQHAITAKKDLAAEDPVTWDVILA